MCRALVANDCEGVSRPVRYHHCICKLQQHGYGTVCQEKCYESRLMRVGIVGLHQAADAESQETTALEDDRGRLQTIAIDTRATQHHATPYRRIVCTSLPCNTSTVCVINNAQRRITSGRVRIDPHSHPPPLCEQQHERLRSGSITTSIILIW